MSSADIVKSAYMIDPSDGCSLVKREAEAGTEIDREYWQRVNQARTNNTHGNNTTNAKKTFWALSAGLYKSKMHGK